jgi:hypothetical protein
MEKERLIVKKYGKQWQWGFGEMKDWTEYYCTDETGCGIFKINVQTGEKHKMMDQADWAATPFDKETKRQIRHWMKQGGAEIL